MDLKDPKDFELQPKLIQNIQKLAQKGSKMDSKGKKWTELVYQLFKIDSKRSKTPKNFPSVEITIEKKT